MFCIFTYYYYSQVLLEWFWDGSSCPYYYRYHFCFHIPHALISIMNSLYFKIFSTSLLISFLSPGIAAYIDMHVPCLLSRIMMSGLLLGIVLSVRTFWFHNMVTLLLDLFRLILAHGRSYQCLLSNFTPIYLHMLKCSWAHTLSCFCVFFYQYWASWYDVFHCLIKLLT